MFSLLSLCVGSFRPTSRKWVGDHVNNACLRYILMRFGCRHLEDTCTWLIVAHRHARTSSHSAERLNQCLSGKELFRLSLFPVICAWQRSRVAHGVGLLLWNRVTRATLGIHTLALKNTQRDRRYGKLTESQKKLKRARDQLNSHDEVQLRKFRGAVLRGRAISNAQTRKRIHAVRRGRI